MIFVQTINDELEQLVDVKLVTSCYTMLELDIQQQTRRAAYSSQDRKTVNKSLIFAMWSLKELFSNDDTQILQIRLNAQSNIAQLYVRTFSTKTDHIWSRLHFSLLSFINTSIFSRIYDKTLHSSPIPCYNQGSNSFITVTLLVSKQRHIQLTVRWAKLTYIMKIK